jgi:hypothetical protein
VAAVVDAGVGVVESLATVARLLICGRLSGADPAWRPFLFRFVTPRIVT